MRWNSKLCIQREDWAHHACYSNRVNHTNIDSFLENTRQDLAGCKTTCTKTTWKYSFFINRINSSYKSGGKNLSLFILNIDKSFKNWLFKKILLLCFIQNGACLVFRKLENWWNIIQYFHKFRTAEISKV